MKLYAFIVAPNPTRVRLYLAEKAALGTAIELEQVMINLREGEQKLPEHVARNALGKVPVLELDDGSFLTESLAIIEYLEELHPKPPLIGATPRERARVHELERIVETGVLMPIGWIVHSTNSPLGMAPIPEVSQLFRGVLPSFLEVLEGVLSDGRPFLAGDTPTIADFTLAAAFQFARFGQVEPELSENLARWDAAYRDREPVKTVLVL